ncbi:YidH family protein [Rhodococcus sp. NPDC127528]|uniref:YidH family protein n=1 Tax=unclassified Rhodococcus (in: high G+C Gram-positive bacteria) TaxID=192944 RepID=UPI00363B0105
MPDAPSEVPDRPDERFTLASERTFLAWIRTSLGLLAGGIAMVHLVPEFSTGWVRTLLGVVLILLAVAAPIAGLRRWMQVRRALESGAPMPQERDLWVFGVGVAVVAAVAAVATLIGA